MNVDDLPAVTFKFGGVVGGFEVGPDCAATAVSRHATIESGATRILSGGTEFCMYTRSRVNLGEE